MLLTLCAFLVAIAVLVAVHEWGHFAMARACGVKVLCFSIGFGPRVVGWTSKRSGTEYQLGVLPLGGFVRMLDEREAAVEPADLPFAFNRMSLPRRALIVAAGPLANLLLAVALYSCVNWMGVEEPQARMGRPPAGSFAERAGLRGGELVTGVAAPGEPVQAVRSFEDLRWSIAKAALGASDLILTYQTDAGTAARELSVPFSELQNQQLDAAAIHSLGFDMPLIQARIGEVRQDGAAHAAGLEQGDRVVQVDGLEIVDAGQLRDYIRHSGEMHVPDTQTWVIERGQKRLTLEVTPHRELDANAPVGRIGAMIGAAPHMLTVQYGLVGGVARAVEKTWDVSRLTLSMMGQIATGAASYKNLSGPITIADYAGRSASMGGTQFLTFLALVSISLGVLNLLPVPVLDGGHLMYYLWEALSGRPVADAWMARLQRVGAALLLLLMSLAIFNDVSRLLS